MADHAGATRSTGAAVAEEPDARYRALFESADAAVLLLRGSVCEDCNRATLALFRLSSKNEIIGKTPLDFAPPMQPDGRDSAAVVQWNIEQALAKGLHVFEWQAFRSGGEPILLEVRITPYSFGEEQYFQCIAIDITSRKQAEQALRESEERMRGLVETSSAWIWETDADIRHTYTNAFVTTVLGYGPEEFLRLDIRSLVHPDDHHLLDQLVTNAVGRRKPWSGRMLRWRHKDGSWKHLESSGTPFFDRRGAFAGLRGVDRDVTDRARAEQELADREGLLRQIMDTASVAIFLVNREGRITHANRRMAVMFDCTMDELVGSEYVAWVHPSERETGRQKMLALLEGAIPSVALERQYTRKDGSEFWGHLAGRRFHDARGIERGLIGVITDITERRRAEAELRSINERLNFLLTAGPAVIYASGAAGDFGATFVSENIFTQLGYRPQEFIDDPGFWLKNIHPSDEARVTAALGKLYEQDPYEHEYRFRHADGSYRWMHDVLRVLRDPDGTPREVVGCWVDVTAQRKIEAEARESEEKFRSIFGQLQDGILIADVETRRFVEANESMCKMLGYSREELLGLGMQDLHRPEDLPAVERAFEQQLRGELALAAGVPVRRRDGSVFFADVNGAILQVAGRACLAGIFRDITERKRAELELRISQEQLWANLNNTPNVAVQWYDEDGCVRFWNPASEAIFGWTADEAIGKTLDQLILTPEETAEFLRTLCDVRTTGRPFGPFETPFRRRDGSEGWLLSTTFCMPMPGKRLGFVCMDVDITARKRTEDALRQSEERFRDLAESLPLTVFEADLEGRLTYVNRAALETFGHTQQDVEAGLNVVEVLAPQDRDRARTDMLERFTGGGPPATEYLALRKDGTTFPVTVASSPILQSGEPAGLRGIVIDLTERRQLEEERLKAQKLESIGTLAGGIAHDFNNLLQGVFGYVSMAKLSIDQREQSLAMLEQAEKALHLSVNLTSQLLTFSRGGKPVKKRISLVPVIDDAAKFALSGSRSGYRFESEPGLWQVDADAGQLAQVIQNVVLNADQAMPLGGTVQVTARNVAASDPELPSCLGHRNHVAISVRDSGIGIPVEYVGRIFDPYFTTKEKGSGLGLATSYSIIKNHEGWITVTSDVGRGTAFTIYLPAAIPETGQDDRAVTHVPLRAGRILLMDDEEVVRSVAGALLRALGHEAVFAEKGEAALDAYRDAREAGRPFDVVILDLTIRGGMGGAETLRKLRELDPQVKAVVSSGYSGDGVLADHEKLGFSAFLNKPYDLSKLRDTLAGLLGG